MESDDNTEDVSNQLEHTLAEVNESFSHDKANPKVAKMKRILEDATQDLTDTEVDEETETSARLDLSPSPASKSAEIDKKIKLRGPRKPWSQPHDLPKGFPDEKAELTEDQIKQLISQAPSFRKRYCHYFSVNGNIKQAFYNLIFEKKPDGEMKYEDWVLNSNLPCRWDNAMQRWEQRSSSAKQARKRQTKTSKNKETGEEAIDAKDCDNSVDGTEFSRAKEAERLCTPASDVFFETSPHAAGLPTATDKAATSLVPESTANRSAQHGPSSSSIHNESFYGSLRQLYRTPRSERLESPFVRPERRRSRSPRGNYAAQNKDEAKAYVPAHLPQSIHKCLDDGLAQSIKQYEDVGVELMNLDDLAAFAMRMERNITKVNAALNQASEKFGNMKVKKTLNELMASFLALQMSCMELQEQMERDAMQAGDD
jgi:hypothetical protein